MTNTKLEGSIELDKVIQALSHVPRYNAGAYGAMSEREQGAYFHVTDLLEVLGNLSGASPEEIHQALKSIYDARAEAQDLEEAALAA